jgi:putative tricarboxylic transport membrane protein
MKRTQLDFIAGLLLAAFSLVLYILSYDFTGYKIMSQARDVGPTFLPRLLLILLAIQSVFLIIQSYRKLRNDLPEGESGKVHLFHFKPFLLFVIFLAYVYMAVVLGYLTSTFLFLLASFFLLGLRKLWMLMVIPPATTALVYLLFEKLLGIWLPGGILF